MALFSKTVKYISSKVCNIHVFKFAFGCLFSYYTAFKMHKMHKMHKMQHFQATFQNILGSMPPGSPEAQAPLALVRSISSLDHTLPQKKSAFGPDWIWQKKQLTLGCNVEEIQLTLDAVIHCEASCISICCSKKSSCPPQGGLLKILRGLGGLKKPSFLRESMNLNWNFQRETILNGWDLGVFGTNTI